MINGGSIFLSRVCQAFPVEPEAVRRNVAVNVLELSTSTECENDLQTPTTTLLCPRDMFLACFDYLLSSLLVDGNVLMGPRLVVRIQRDMLIWSLRSPSDCATLPPPRSAQPLLRAIDDLQNPLPQYCVLHSSVSYDLCPQTFPFFHSALLILEMI